MFLCLCLACVSQNADGGSPRNEMDAMTRYDARSVRACAVIDDDSPSFPSRLVFLHKTDREAVDAQSELFAFDASSFRCGEVTLHLVPGRDGTPVVMDFMPPADAVTIRELRVYRFDTAWNPEDPFALAVEDRQPFRDYEFRVNESFPYTFDAKTIYVGGQ